MYVKPAEGRAPRDPQTMLRVPSEGQHVNEHDANWQMLLRHGDLVLAEPPPSPPDVPALENEEAGHVYEFGHRPTAIDEEHG